MFGAVVAAIAFAGVVGGTAPAGASTPTLSKTTALRFYDRVTVHTGEALGAPVLIDQCFDTDTAVLSRCVPLADTSVPASGDVGVVLMRRVESRDRTEGTTTFLDCIAPGVTCQVSVRVVAGTTVIPVTFDPAAPLPVLSVTPNSDLGWSTTATVHGSGFLPDQEILVTQCAHVVAYGTDGASCVGALHAPHATADATGAFAFPTKIRRLIPSHFDPARGTVDCAHVQCFERAALAPLNRDDRPAYAKGAVEAGLDIADDGIPVALMRKTFLQTEHRTELKINVDLTAAAASPLTITYTTGAAPPGGYPQATAGSDYVAKLSHHLYFQPGETHHEIRISILDDSVSEPTEQFAVNLSGSFHANTRIAIVTIGNDDH